MTHNEIAIKKLSKVLVPSMKDYSYDLNNDSDEIKYVIYSFGAELNRLGYVMSKNFANSLAIQYKTNKQAFMILVNEVLGIVAKLKGADVKHKPMYPNFPQQVMEASDYELFVNAIIHYWSFGEYLPVYTEKKRDFFPEKIKYRTLDVCSEEEFRTIFTKILASNDSISEYDKTIINFFFDNYHMSLLKFPESITYKETLCYIVGILYKRGMDVGPLFSTCTDVLRFITYLSDGDITLAKNTKFKSFPRKDRKYFSALINKLINEEDLKRNRGRWVRLFHALHIGEYTRNPLITKTRSNKNLNNTLGNADKFFRNNKFVLGAAALKKRPGEFARKLDYMLRNTETDEAYEIVQMFSDVMDKVSTRVLMQLYGHFIGRYDGYHANRFAFIKGNTQKAMIVPKHEKDVHRGATYQLLQNIENTLIKRFGSLPALGNVYIDKHLFKCPLPSQQRSAADALKSFARGTRIPLNLDKNTIRMFLYWVGRDIDLSGVFLDENFNYKGHISYTSLRGINCCHSGDITRAPEGASEFMDLDIKSCLAAGVRYAAISVHVFSGPTFKEHETCFVGWMSREAPKSNEIYDPKTVENKIDLNADSMFNMPIIFDFKEMEAIWVDLDPDAKARCFGNNIESNYDTIYKIAKGIVEGSVYKSNLYDLFELHAKARGTIVENIEDANTVFSMKTGIKPSDINIINSEYLV